MVWLKGLSHHFFTLTPSVVTRKYDFFTLSLAQSLLSQDNYLFTLCLAQSLLSRGSISLRLVWIKSVVRGLHFCTLWLIQSLLSQGIFLYNRLKGCCHGEPFFLYGSLTTPHLSLNHESLLGTTDDFTTSSLHFALFSTALWNLVNSKPDRSLDS